MALSRISQAKNQMQGPEAMAGTSSWNFRDQQIAKVYERYVAILKESGAVDFDDLLLKTVELFDKAGARPQALRDAVHATSRSTSTRTPTGRSTCWCSSWRRCTATSPSSATPTSRSTSGAARM